MDGGKRLLSSSINPADMTASGGYGRSDSPYESAPLTIYCLPTELLLYIFSFLNINERLNVARVCRTWRYLIFSSSSLWDKKQLKLKCNKQSHQSRRSCMYTKRLGHFLRKLTINCEHPNNHQCKVMAVCFRKLIKNLKSKNPALTSFKVLDLRLAGAAQPVVAKVCILLSKLLESLGNLRNFQMSSAQWPPEEGKAVMYTLIRVSKNTLETLQIDGYFVPRYTPVEMDQFGGEISTLTRLTKLGIDYCYLTTDSVIVLAEARKGQMKKLKLLAYDISPNTQYISKQAWQHLTTLCPAMRVEFCIKAFVISPSRSIPAILEPVLHISMIRLSIGGQFTFLDTPRLNMAAVFQHIITNFRKRLIRFEMDIDNYNDFIDAAFIKMVKKCKHLLHLKVIAFFQNEETDAIVSDIVQRRRMKQDGTATRMAREPATPYGASNDDMANEPYLQGDGRSACGSVCRKKGDHKTVPFDFVWDENEGTESATRKSKKKSCKKDIDKKKGRKKDDDSKKNCKKDDDGKKIQSKTKQKSSF